MPLLEVGRIVKPHGLRGEVIVELTTNRSERVAAGSVLDASGTPLRIVRSAPHQARWIVAFEGVDDRDAADGLRGEVLRAEPLDDADALWVHELIGSRVQHVDGRVVGEVVSVEANPASDLLVLDSGALVPLRFVMSHEPGLLTVDPPPGLLE